MAEYLIQTVKLSEWITWSLLAVLSAVLILNLMAGGALVFIWAERKVSARIQDRLGPTRTGGSFGWLQSLADGIKLLAKEDLMPQGADGMLFRVAPYVSFCASFAAFIGLPFAFDMVGLRLNVGVFYVIAVLGLEVFGVILASDARGCPGRELRGASGHVHCRASHARRDNGSGDDRGEAGRLVHQLVSLPRSIHLRRLLGIRDVCRRERQ
jgi:hypothetical protein